MRAAPIPPSAVALAAAVGAFADAVYAQEVDRGAYAGLGVGNFEYEEDIVDEAARASFSDSAAAFKLYGGYRFSDHFALEASFQSTDTVEESFPANLQNFGLVDLRVGADFDAAALKGVGHLPLSWGSVFLGAGYFDADWDVFADIDDAGDVLRFDDTFSEDGLTAVLGLQWELATVSLRAEYEWWDIDEADVFQLGLTVHYRF